MHIAKALWLMTSKRSTHYYMSLELLKVAVSSFTPRVLCTAWVRVYTKKHSYISGSSEKYLKQTFNPPQSHLSRKHANWEFCGYNYAKHFWPLKISFHGFYWQCLGIQNWSNRLCGQSHKSTITTSSLITPATRKLVSQVKQHCAVSVRCSQWLQEHEIYQLSMDF